MAEREGFEPPIPVKVCPLSRRIVSTTHAPLRAVKVRGLLIILSGAENLSGAGDRSPSGPVNLKWPAQCVKQSDAPIDAAALPWDLLSWRGVLERSRRASRQRQARPQQK